jgi:predicted hotdog family 3-hydroxylacyl-ACP dehydratase
MILKAPENYLPHRSPMLLIDSILAINATTVSCQLTVRENNIFYDADVGGIHNWIGIEIMAQTAGVFAFFQNPEPKPQFGFLLSVRKFSCQQKYFNLHDVLTITAQNEYLQDNIGVFQCSIIIGNNLIASAKLNALQPTAEQTKLYLASI